jgi:hypothetical protein
VTCDARIFARRLDTRSSQSLSGRPEEFPSFQDSNIPLFHCVDRSRRCCLAAAISARRRRSRRLISQNEANLFRANPTASRFWYDGYGGFIPEGAVENKANFPRAGRQIPAFAEAADGVY